MDTSIQSLRNARPSAWPSQKPIPINHPLVPYVVRDAVRKTGKPSRLYRVVTLSIVEWWLMDLDGDLLDIYWMNDTKSP